MARRHQQTHLFERASARSDDGHLIQFHGVGIPSSALLVPIAARIVRLIQPAQLAYPPPRLWAHTLYTKPLPFNVYRLATVRATTTATITATHVQRHQRVQHHTAARAASVPGKWHGSVTRRRTQGRGGPVTHVHRRHWYRLWLLILFESLGRHGCGLRS